MRVKWKVLQTGQYAFSPETKGNGQRTAKDMETFCKGRERS